VIHVEQRACEVSLQPRLTYKELQHKLEALSQTATQFQEAKVMLQDSADLVDSILECSPVGIGLVENRIIKRVNSAMLKLFGFNRESDFVGKSARIIYPNEATYQKVGKQLYNSLSSGEPAAIDADFVRKDGTSFYGHLKASCPDPTHPWRNTTVVLSDISWRRSAELEGRQREKLQGVLEMAGAVCHELNQPMQEAMFTCSDLLSDEPLTQAELQQKARRIKEQLNRMANMTRRLMRITRYETIDYINGEKIIDIEKSSSP
jgi:PAS domain S-box-containing protein